SDLADLAHELAVARELQDRAVILGVAAQPDETLAVGEDTMFAADPLVAGAAAPAAQEIALGIELHDGRRRHAALAARRRQGRASFIGCERAGPLQHPDMILSVDGQATDLPEQPVVG